jgi:chromosome segregation ATPase
VFLRLRPCEEAFENAECLSCQKKLSEGDKAKCEFCGYRSCEKHLHKFRPYGMAIDIELSQDARSPAVKSSKGASLSQSEKNSQSSQASPEKQRNRGRCCLVCDRKFYQFAVLRNILERLKLDPERLGALKDSALAKEQEYQQRKQQIRQAKEANEARQRQFISEKQNYIQELGQLRKENAQLESLQSEKQQRLKKLKQQLLAKQREVDSLELSVAKLENEVQWDSREVERKNKDIAYLQEKGHQLRNSLRNSEASQDAQRFQTVRVKPSPGIGEENPAFQLGLSEEVPSNFQMDEQEEEPDTYQEMAAGLIQKPSTVTSESSRSTVNSNVMERKAIKRAARKALKNSELIGS